MPGSLRSERTNLLTFVSQICRALAERLALQISRGVHCLARIAYRALRDIVIYRPRSAGATVVGPQGQVYLENVNSNTAYLDLSTVRPCPR